ncbi:MAG: hypothetical protein ACR2PT_15620 [Endozoicomonas sp.]
MISFRCWPRHLFGRYQNQDDQAIHTELLAQLLQVLQVIPNGHLRQGWNTRM